MVSYVVEMDSPIRRLRLRSNGRALVALEMLDDPDQPLADDDRREADALLERARAELTEYFAGARREFDLPLEPAGTDFQRRVWQALRAIPYGATISYRTLAERIGQPTATRAVGLANGRNPIAIVIPCHRVIGADGSLTGYGGGLERKRTLLDLEARRTGADAAPGSRPASRAAPRAATTLTLPGFG